MPVNQNLIQSWKFKLLRLTDKKYVNCNHWKKGKVYVNEGNFSHFFDIHNILRNF